MKTLNIDFSDENARRIEEIAERMNLSPEALIRSTMEEKIHQFDADFEKTAQRVLEKNEELYRRLS